MRSADAIKSILEEQGRSQRSLAIDLGLTPQALDQRLKSKTMKVETLCQTAAQLVGRNLGLPSWPIGPRGLLRFLSHTMPNFLMMRCTFLRLILTFCSRARQSTICCV